jgi:hypothetical protein
VSQQIHFGDYLLTTSVILGYQNEDVAAKFSKFMEHAEPLSNNIDGLSDQMSKLNRVSIHPAKSKICFSSAFCSANISHFH